MTNDKHTPTPESVREAMLALNPNIPRKNLALLVEEFYTYEKRSNPYLKDDLDEVERVAIALDKAKQSTPAVSINEELVKAYESLLNSYTAIATTDEYPVVAHHRATLAKAKGEAVTQS